MEKKEEWVEQVAEEETTEETKQFEKKPLTYWDLLVRAVLLKHQNALNTVPTTNTLGKPLAGQALQVREPGMATTKYKRKKRRRKRKLKTYPLGVKFPRVVLTQREAECMRYAIRGKTILQTSRLLRLSSRTVEFYLNNIKRKVDCDTKSQLIGIIVDTDFMKYIDTL